MTGTTAAPPSARHPTQPAYAGWHLVGFDSELAADVCPLTIGDRPVVVVRDGGRRRVFDATCPHRGAHLGYGGELSDGYLVCPFHGRRIHLGDNGSLYSVAEHRCVEIGGALFVAFRDGPDRGFTARLDRLGRGHDFVAALTRTVRAPASLIIENAFDGDHFVPVHGLRRSLNMTVGTDADGALTVDGQLEAPGPPPWAQAPPGPHRSRFAARAYSPNLVLSEIGPTGFAPVVLTGAVPTAQGCTARVFLAVPRRQPDEPVPTAHLDGLVRGTQRAFGQDIEIWENLDPSHVEVFDPHDAAVLAFREFCEATPRARP